MAMYFNTLAAVQRIEAAGLSRLAAEAVVTEIAGAQIELADKDDIARLAADHERLEARFAADNERLEARLAADNERLEARLAADNERVEKRLDACATKDDIARLAEDNRRLEAKLTEEIARVEKRLDTFATQDVVTRIEKRLDSFATKEDLARVEKRLDSFATKDELRAEIADVRTEIAALKSSLIRWIIVSQSALLGVGIALIQLLKLLH